MVGKRGPMVGAPFPHNLLYKFAHHDWKIHHNSPSFPQTFSLKPRVLYLIEYLIN